MRSLLLFFRDNRFYLLIFLTLIFFYCNSEANALSKYQVDAGWARACALGFNGVTCWGENSNGQTEVPELSNPTQISVGTTQICVTEDSGIVCWGHGLHPDLLKIPILPASAQLSAGGFHTCALANAEVVCWGDNVYNQTEVPELINPIQIDASQTHTCAIDDRGVVCWGGNRFGQNDVPNLSNPIEIATGSNNSCAIDDTGVVCWGNSDYGQLTSPELSNPRKISVGLLHICALDDKGVICWGYNEYAQTDVPHLTNPTQIDVSNNYSCALDDSGVVCWGDNTFGQTDVPSNLSFGPKVDGICGNSNGGKFIIAPTDNLCSIGKASTITEQITWKWSCEGENNGKDASCSAFMLVPGITFSPRRSLVTTEAGGTEKLQIILNTQPSAEVSISVSSSDTSEVIVEPKKIVFDKTNWNIPQEVTVTGVDDNIIDKHQKFIISFSIIDSLEPDYSEILAIDIEGVNKDRSKHQIVAGLDHTCALNIGKVTCWGRNYEGQSEVPDLINPTRLTASWYHTCALDDSGVVCWGETDDIKNIPQLSNPSEIISSYSHMCAIDDSGVLCWGDKLAGLTNVPSLSNPTQIALGSTHTCALNDTGVVCWGWNSYGQLDIPVLSNPTNIFAGENNSCAIDDTGVVCWGDNQYGQNEVPILSNPSKISIGSVIACALDDSGTVCWGGENFTDNDGITKVPSLPSPLDIGLGNFHTCTLFNTGAACWGQDWYGETSVPSNSKFEYSGECGASHTTFFESPPSNNLCSTGTPSEFTQINPWKWICEGSDEHLKVSCSTSTKINGICGNSNASSFSNKPDKELCATGTASSVTGNGPWSWTCSGASGDITASCSANLVIQSPGISVSPFDSLLTSEDGNTAEVHISLTTQPGSNVSIKVSSNDTSEGVVNTNGLTFTPENWNISQTVKITGVDDNSEDGDQNYKIVVSPTESVDPNYNGIVSTDIKIINLERSDVLIDGNKQFIKISERGDELPDIAEEWACVKHSVTGQIWEVKEDAEEYNVIAKTYSFDEASNYANQINQTGLCGYKDWRVPTIKELNSISNRTLEGKAIDNTYFPNSFDSDIPSESGGYILTNYWSSTKDLKSDKAYFFQYKLGELELNEKSAKNYVRLVRGEQFFDFFDYSKQDSLGNTLSENKINQSCIQDNKNSLMWEVKTSTNSADKYTFNETTDYVNHINKVGLCGFHDWRLPMIDELVTLVDYQTETGGIAPKIKTFYFPSTYNPMMLGLPISEWSLPTYWSRSHFVVKSHDSLILDRVWTVRFDTGYVYENDKSNALHIRLVRNSEASPFLSADLSHKYTKIDNNGMALPYSKPNWRCVKNNVTGQTWEVKTEENMDQKHTLTDAAEYVTTVNQNKLCGYNDWRMPTVKELFSITDKTSYNPSIDINYFPNTQVSYYSVFGDGASNSSGYLSNITSPFSSQPINLYFEGGFVRPGYSPDNSYIRLVRGEQYFDLFDYTKLDGAGNPLNEESTVQSCVRDNRSGLVWEVKTKENIDNKYILDNIPEYKNKTNQNELCGFNDWRLPTIDELITLVDYGDIHPSIKEKYFPNTQIYFSGNIRGYWSESPFARKSDSGLELGASNNWNIYFSNGQADVFNILDYGYVRLVRGGQSEKVDQLFDWAEQNYPQWFSPPGKKSFELYGYQVRYYEGFKNYIGEKNGRVYVYGDAFNGLKEVDLLVDLLKLIQY